MTLAIGANGRVAERVDVRQRAIDQRAEHFVAALVRQALNAATPHNAAEVHFLLIDIHAGAPQLLGTRSRQVAEFADVAFYNQRGTCEQYIKEGKNAIKWTRLSCRSFAANAVRLQLHALAYNLGNFMRTLAMPRTAEPWSLTSLREKLIKIGAKVVSHGRYVTFQMAEVAVPRQMFQEILSLIAQLRAPPVPV